MTSSQLSKPSIVDALAPLLDEQPPKCTSWRGHRFEARYDDFGGLDHVFKLESFNATEVVAIINSRQKRRVYIRDVCTRCGYTIERAR
jgi:Na+-translocating ferredoxin:NAD+ oxidoreductase RNF subunit RnfB